MDSQAKNNGGPAFPRDERHLGHNGMSLRDWFAGQALGAVATISIQPGMKAADGGPIESRHIAQAAYNIADAMLAERSKP